MTRVAAVTGGAGAIGGAIAAGLRAAGHEIAIFDLNGTPVVDLANRGAVQAGAAAVLDRYGRCDVLVHAAAALLDLRRRRRDHRPDPVRRRRPGAALSLVLR